MTYPEKKAALAAHKSEQTMWNVLVAVLGINLIWSLYSIIMYFSKNSDAASGFLGSFIVVGVILGLALSAWITWGVYKLERWVTMWMWIGLVLSILSFNLIGILIYAAVLIIYKKVLKVVYPSAPAAPTPQV